MKNIVLPEIVAVGIYNARLAVKNTELTKNRRTTMFEIELPIEDGGVSYIDAESHPITENVLISVKPGQTRHTRLPFKCYYVHMIVREGEIFDRLMRTPSYIKVGDRDRFERIFKSLIECYSISLGQDILMIQSLILELVHLLSEYGEESVFSGKSANKEMIESVVDFVKNNLTSDLSLEAMSKYTSFSPIHFHNCFKRATGKTLCQFVEEQRIQKAISLLLGTDLTLSEVAYECGFSSQSYFNYAFKKKMGFPPREYARRLHNKYDE